MRISRSAIVAACLGGVVVFAGSGCGGKKETFNATICYVLEPTETLPEGLTTIAVLDAGTEMNGSEDDERAKKWATIAADMIEQMILDSAKKFGTGLSVAKRRDTSKVLAERDLQAAGLVQGPAAVEAGKLLDVQALITSRLNIRVETKKTKKKSLNISRLASVAGGRWGAPNLGGSEEAEAVARSLTVQCKFSMIDATTGDAYFEYAPRPFRKFDRKTPGVVFGHSAGEADLDPVDMYIGELVEKGVREFVSMFVPCEVEYTYEVKSSGSKASKAGVAAMRAEDYEAAMEHFKAAVAEDPEDHRSVFCMGVVSELTGDWDAALKYYKRACGMLGVDKDEMAMYLAAKDRLARHKDRIRKAGG